MKKFLLTFAFWLLPFAVYAACPTTSLQFKDANGTTQILCFGGASGAFIPQYQILDGSGGMNALGVNASGQLTISNSSFASTQSGTWNVGLNAGSSTVGKFDLLGNLGAVLDFAGQNASSPPNAVLVGAQFNTSPSTIASGNVSPIQVDNGGRLIVNCTSGCGGSGGTSIADEAPFTQGSTSLTVGGGYFSSSPANLTTGQAGAFRLTNTRHLMVDLEDIGGTAFALGQTTMGSSLPVVVASNQSNINVAVASALPAGSNTIGAVTQASGPWTNNITQIGGSALTLGQTTMTSSIPVTIASNQSAVPASQSGTWSTRTQDGSGNAIGSTTGALNVNCANCSGSGVSQTDEGAFSAGVSSFASGGGFFQTTATSNPLTTGQFGTFQVTANRALFTNIRNSSGTELATASNPLQVSLANTGSNGTLLNNNITQFGGSNVVTGIGASGAGIPRVSISTDSTLAANQSVNLSQINGQTAANGGVTGSLLTEQGCAGQSVGNTSTVAINNAASSSNLKLVSLASSKNVYICQINISSGAGLSVALVEGTKVTNECDTSTAGMAGGATAATGWNLMGTGQLAIGNGQGVIAKTSGVSHSVCLLFSAAIQVSGSITYAQF